MSRFIVFDVETPNFRNERMSAIGICVVENGCIQKEFYSLVDPEQHFDEFNIALTGISPEKVKGQPTFDKLWQQIEPVMSSGVLIAHNAPFDMSVLASCLGAYGINWNSHAYYACTCRMARKFDMGLPNHKLNTMCSCYGISLDHHHAMSDASACAKLFTEYFNRGEDILPFVKKYDLHSKKTVQLSKKEVMNFENNLSCGKFLLG